MVVYIRVSVIDEFMGWGGIHGNPPPVDSIDLKTYNSNFSVMLFLSISAFGTMFLPLSLIFNPTRRIASYLAPMLVLGGFLNLLTNLIGNYAHQIYDLDASGNYTFMGTLWYDDGAVIRHFLLFIMSYLVLFNVPKYKL
ncbi:hypothetical protein FACS1894166_05640 [Bacilli bacterium]|nr:hypothetical protein FACS1894166_05640 [Bacilli bacterium]